MSRPVERHTHQPFFVTASKVDPSTKLDESCLIELPKVVDPRGNLTYVEENRHIPFPIARVYYLYDVPGETARGGHAHTRLHQLLIAVSGSFDVVLDDGAQTKRYHLNSANVGLHIRPMSWRTLEWFSPGTVCLVLASEPYDEAEYIRDYDQFRRICIQGRTAA